MIYARISVNVDKRKGVAWFSFENVEDLENCENDNYDLILDTLDELFPDLEIDDPEIQVETECVCLEKPIGVIIHVS